MFASDKRNGVPCLVASRKIEINNARWSVWLSEGDEFNPVFFEEKYEVNGEPGIKTTEIEWQRATGGHLFPKRLKHNSKFTFHGTKSESEHLVIITLADFESSINPAVFTVAGFGLNENQVIGFPELEGKDEPHWRNGKIDYSNNAVKPEIAAGGQPVAVGPLVSAPHPGQGNITGIIAIVAAMLAVVALIAAVVIRRKRTAT